MNEEGHFLAGAKNSGYLGDPENREIYLGIVDESDSNPYTGFLVSRGILKSNLKNINKAE